MMAFVYNQDIPRAAFNDTFKIFSKNSFVDTSDDKSVRAQACIGCASQVTETNYHSASPCELAPVNIFHVAERNAGIVFARILKVERAACQEDEIAIEILGNGRAAARHELVKHSAVVSRDPSRELKPGCAPIDFQPIFGQEPCAEHVELQWANNPDQRRGSVSGPEYLCDAFLGQLVQRQPQLLGPHGIGQTDPAQDLGCEVRDALKIEVLAFGQGVADAERAVIRNPNHVAGVGFLGERAILGKEELRCV